MSMIPASYAAPGVTVAMKHAGVVASPMSTTLPTPLLVNPANMALASAGPLSLGSRPTAMERSPGFLPFFSASQSTKAAPMR